MNKSDYYHKYLTEIQPHRDVTRSNFASGQMRYRIYLGDNEAWNPYESFFKIRCSLTQGDGTTVLTGGEGIGPNMFLGDSLFQSQRLSCNDKVINEQTDYCHQISVLRQRLNKPDKWLEGIGESLNFTETRLDDRIAQVASNHLDFEHDLTNMDREALGFDAAGANNTIAITAAGLMTFVANGTALPNLDDAFRVGDEIEFFNNGANTITQFRIESIQNVAGTINVVSKALIVADPADAANDISVIKRAKVRNKKNAKEFEILWKPGLGVFQEINGQLPGGCTYEINLTPFPSLVVQTNAIESFINKTPNTDYVFEVVNMNMYVCKYESHNPMPKGDLEICFDQIRCQAQTLNTTSLTQKNYDVHPMTHSLSICYQDNRAGQETQFSRGKFKIANDEDLNLTRLYVQYANKTLPNPIPDMDYNRTTNRDFFSQRYIETQLYSKGIMHPSVEPLQRWYDRGPIYHWKWPRSFDRKHEAVIISQNFSGTFDDKPQVLLFDWHKKMVKFEMSGNRVSKVSAY